MRRPGKLGVVAGLAGVALLLASCSSTSSSKGSGQSSAANSTSAAASASGATSTVSCIAAADAYLKPWDTLPTSLPSQYTPLQKAPAKGKTVIKLVGPIPSDSTSFDAQAQAASLIGWTAKKITFDGTVEDLNAKFEEAISDKPAVITLGGHPVAEIQQPLADAKAAGIVVSLSSVLDLPSSNPGYAANGDSGPTSKTIGILNAEMFLRASKCAGDAAIFNLAGYPILNVATDAFTATVKANCPACKVSYNEVQAKAIGTPAVTSAIVSKLQSDPSTKYVYTIIANVAAGLTTALSQAGLTGISIFGQVPDANAIKALQDGTNAWWINQASAMNGFNELDAALRAIDTGKLLADNGHYPLSVLTPQNVPSGTALPVYPVDYQQEFAKLWNVG